MRRIGVSVGIGALAGIAVLLGTAACGTPAKTTAAPVRVASAAPVLNPVPENATTRAQAAAPRPRLTSRAPRPAAPAPATDAGSGNAGLDRFVAAVQRDLPGV